MMENRVRKISPPRITFPRHALPRAQPNAASGVCNAIGHFHDHTAIARLSSPHPSASQGGKVVENITHFPRFPSVLISGDCPFSVSASYLLPWCSVDGRLFPTFHFTPDTPLRSSVNVCNKHPAHSQLHSPESTRVNGGCVRVCVCLLWSGRN